MIRSMRKTHPVYAITDMFFMLTSFFVPYVIKYNSFDSISTRIHLPNLTEYGFIFLLWGLFILYFFKHKHLFDTNRNLSVTKELSQVCIRVFYASIVVGSVVFLMKYKFFSRFIFLGNFSLLCIFLGGWRVVKRLILRKLIKGGYHNINILVVGNNEIFKMVFKEIKEHPYLGLKVIGILDDHQKSDVDGISVLGGLSDFNTIVKKYFVQEVVITIPFTQKSVFDLIEEAQKMRLGVKIIPEHLEEPLPILGVSYLGIIPLLSYQKRRNHPTETVSKRLLDVTVSLSLIILLFIPCVVIAILIKLDSPGPLFYIQKRVGLKGVIFNLYKFRSMRKGADKLKDELLEKNESEDKVMFKIKKDPRVTKIGKFLRKYSLDELLQLFNVLKGDMSLVGPRPSLPDEVKKYDPCHIERLSIRPGLTGLSQIRGRSDLSFSRWVKWDLWYVNNWSFKLDISILLQTIPVVLKGKGAY